MGAAERAQERGGLQEWVVAYMSHDAWRNDGLAEGIGLAPRWWIGPNLVSVDSLVRVCGPEAGMPYRVTAQSWEERTTAIAASMRASDFDVRSMPPLIAEYRDGGFSIADGNHRLGAFASVGRTSAWVVIWANSEEDHRNAVMRLAESS